MTGHVISHDLLKLEILIDADFLEQSVDDHIRPHVGGVAHVSLQQRRIHLPEQVIPVECAHMLQELGTEQRREDPITRFAEPLALPLHQSGRFQFLKHFGSEDVSACALRRAGRAPGTILRRHLVQIGQPGRWRQLLPRGLAAPQLLGTVSPERKSRHDPGPHFLPAGGSGHDVWPPPSLWTSRVSPRHNRASRNAEHPHRKYQRSSVHGH